VNGEITSEILHIDCRSRLSVRLPCRVEMSRRMPGGAEAMGQSVRGVHRAEILRGLLEEN